MAPVLSCWELRLESLRVVLLTSWRVSCDSLWKDPGCTEGHERPMAIRGNAPSLFGLWLPSPSAIVPSKCRQLRQLKRAPTLSSNAPERVGARGRSVRGIEVEEDMREDWPNNWNETPRREDGEPSCTQEVLRNLLMKALGLPKDRRQAKDPRPYHAVDRGLG